MIWNSYPKPYDVFIAKPSTYAACYLIEFCQIVVTLSEIHFILPWSRSRTHFHHMLYFYTRSKQTSIHPQNKTSSPYMTPLSWKHIKDMGLCKKKNKKMHTQRRYATYLGMLKKRKKEEIAPYPKRKKKRDGAYKEVIHHPPKISTHLHILIKVYDLFLLWIRSLT